MSTEADHEAAWVPAIDFLKLIGLVGIITAHTGPPGWMMTLRSFDVPLLVIVSAILAEMSYARKLEGKHAAITYYIARFKRIVFPTWIFLTVYFGYTLLMGDAPRPAKYYLASYLLTRYGIDYVWIMLIYLYAALMIPLFYHWKLSVGSALTVAAVYILYEWAYHERLWTDVQLMDTTFYYIIPYGVLTWLGCNFRRMSRKTHVWIAVAAASVFAGIVCAMAVKGEWQTIQQAKYPPRIYFLSYGVACAFGLLSFCERHRYRWYSHGAIRFISTHSMSIYLWHVIYLDVYARLGFPERWLLKLAVIFLVSVLTVVGINACLNRIERKWRCPLFKYLR